MHKGFTLLQTIAISGVFSAVSGWYGFMFGRESARKELGVCELVMNRHDSTLVCASVKTRSLLVYDACLLRCILLIGFDCNVLESLAAQVLRKSKMMRLWTTVENDPSFLVEAETIEGT
ncbi:hypothetical protein RDI58_020802 [Solanum bulbocastanum]|uniref:Uncharacterized protein n=1 Tax=Solanum bulbocastanum TaxID=147425 RepID=A0AAN8TFX0_SOLBU